MVTNNNNLSLSQHFYLHLQLSIVHIYIDKYITAWKNFGIDTKKIMMRRHKDLE
jgi:hypothetical protein